MIFPTPPSRASCLPRESLLEEPGNLLDSARGRLNPKEKKDPPKKKEKTWTQTGKQVLRTHGSAPPTRNNNP